VECLKNYPTRLSLKDYFDHLGIRPIDVIEVTSCGENPGPALCSYGCKVGIAEVCPHGCPSVLLTVMLYSYEWDEIDEDGSVRDHMSA
jgi:hypothetical protein